MILVESSVSMNYALPQQTRRVLPGFCPKYGNIRGRMGISHVAASRNVSKVQLAN
jgi:hypothetical protein